MTYEGNINSQYELFKLSDLLIDIFKCLIFVQGLTVVKDKDIRCRILTKIEREPEITQQKVTEECYKLINVKKKDNTQIEEKNISRV